MNPFLGEAKQLILHNFRRRGKIGWCHAAKDSPEHP
jgi:hypothetical protein